MNVEQVKLVYDALTKTGRGRTSSAVAKETGVPVEDVERVVTFIKKSPLFRFTLTKAGLLGKLEIPRLVRGAYTASRDHRGDTAFSKHGKLVKKFLAAEGLAQVKEFAERHKAEAVAAGALYFSDLELADPERVDIVVPHIAECLELMAA